MRTEQASNTITNTPVIYNTLTLYNSSIDQVHYLCLNMFRIMRPLRLKYKLTINEIIFINGALLYHQHEDSSFSSSSLRKYIRYYNLNKFTYYLNSTLRKGLIMQSDIINGNNRYKLTNLSIEILSQLQTCYDKALKDYCLLYGISL